jgi:hypothetical protein
VAGSYVLLEVERRCFAGERSRRGQTTLDSIASIVDEANAL